MPLFFIIKDNINFYILSPRYYCPIILIICLGHNGIKALHRTQVLKLFIAYYTPRLHYNDNKGVKGRVEGPVEVGPDPNLEKKKCDRIQPVKKQSGSN